MASPLLSISDLVSVETQAQVFATFIDIATSIGLDTTAWQSGGPIRSALAVAAQKLADYTQVRSLLAGMGLLDLSSGDWLTLWASSMFGVTRVPAVAATGLVTLTNTGASVGPLAPGALIVAHSVTGATYVNTGTLTIAPGTNANVPIAAVAVGAGSNAAPGYITQMVSSIVGVTVTNPASVLGSDAESDDALKLRCRQQQAATSPAGPSDAYAYVAKTPSYSATSSAITRVSPALNIVNGLVTQYLATANGAPSGGDVTIVQAAFDQWVEPMGFLATAAAAANLTINVTATVALSAKGTTRTVAQIQSDAATALSVYFASLPIGGFVVPPATGLVYQDAIRSVIRDSTPGVITVTLSAPSADVAIATNQVPVLGTISITPVFV